MEVGPSRYFAPAAPRIALMISDRRPSVKAVRKHNESLMNSSRVRAASPSRPFVPAGQRYPLHDQWLAPRPFHLTRRRDKEAQAFGYIVRLRLASSGNLQLV